MSSTPVSKHSCRKWFGVVLILIELITSSATIYGFSAFFIVLANHNIYENYCVHSVEVNSTLAPDALCKDQAKQYEKASTLGIALYDLTSVFFGVLTDALGARFVKLIAVVLHIIGWLALAIIRPGRDYLLFVHTACTSLSGTMIALTAYTSCGYFSKGRAFISALFVGTNIAAAVCYSIFQILIDAKRITLTQLSYTWMSLGFLLIITSFLNLDWRFRLFNLPYQFDTTLEEINTDEKISIETPDVKVNKLKWYQKIYQRKGIWQHLTSSLYVLMTLFLAILFTLTNLLSITWYPWVYHITGQNTSLANKYTFAFNVSSLASIFICPINGFILGFRAERGRAQQLLNIAISQTMTWLLNIISCIFCMFVSMKAIIPALIFNTIAHATIEAGSIAGLSTCFPAKYIGTLSGMMWTVTGLISLMQYGLVDLTQEVPASWRAWLILLVLAILMSSHLIQIWLKYVNEKRRSVLNKQKSKIEALNDDIYITYF